MPEGDVSWDPDLEDRLNVPAGDIRLEVEYRLGLENAVGKPKLVSLYSGGVVGSDWWPVRLKLFLCPNSS